MSSKQGLVSALLDERGYLVFLELSARFTGSASASQLANLPDFVALGLENFFLGVEPTLLRSRSSLARLSPWQERVIRTLAAIPRGKVTDYAGLARLAGSPGAARAVGVACARNPLPLIFPCHRVVYANGDPGAYHHRPADPLKKVLLENEGIKFTQGGRIPREYFL